MTWRAAAALSRPERIIKELGGGKDLSPIYRVLFEPLAQAKGHEYTYMQDLVKKFEAIRPKDKYWQKSLRDKIEDTPWFIDPYTKEPFQLTRGQMINIMLKARRCTGIQPSQTSSIRWIMNTVWTST